MKGDKNDVCYRTVCNNKPAEWWNHVTNKHYCNECAHHLNNDIFNMRETSHPLCHKRFPPMPTHNIKELKDLLNVQPVETLLYQSAAISVFLEDESRLHPDDLPDIKTTLEAIYQCIEEKVPGLNMRQKPEA